MKICLLGTQGTGKSTLAGLFKGEYKIIDNIARNVIKNGGKSNQDGDLDSQAQIFSDYLQALNSNNYISTRSVIDVLAYTTYLIRHKYTDKSSSLLYFYQKDKVNRWLMENPDIVICYVPIEFEIEDDGVRSIDKEYQKEIDSIMKELFDTLNIKHKYVITGNLYDRKQQLAKIIDRFDDTK